MYCNNNIKLYDSVAIQYNMLKAQSLYVQRCKAQMLKLLIIKAKNSNI